MLEEIILANPRGFCEGVNRAIETVRAALNKHGSPVYVRHQIVHNKHVTGELYAMGAVFIESLDQMPWGEDGIPLILSPHGAAPSVMNEAKKRGLKHIIDTTCPFVHKVHSEVRKYAGEGYSILLVGHSGHVEIIGTSGEAPEATQIIETAEDAEAVKVPDENKVACLTQTTLSTYEAAGIIKILQTRFPALVLPPKGDICYATTNRQNAVAELIMHGVNAVLVIGSANSSNTAQLTKTAEKAGVSARRIDDYTEIELPWLAEVRRLGITSGASAPESLVKGVVDYLKLKEHFPEAKVKESEGVMENMKFRLPEI